MCQQLLSAKNLQYHWNIKKNAKVKLIIRIFFKKNNNNTRELIKKLIPQQKNILIIFFHVQKTKKPQANYKFVGRHVNINNR